MRRDIHKLDRRAVALLARNQFPTGVRGGPVIAFDPVPYRLALVQAHADLSIAEAQLDRPS